MKKILTILGTITLIVSASSTVIACGTDSIFERIDPPTNNNDNIDHRKDLGEISNNLGTFYLPIDALPSKEQLLKAINVVNPGLDLKANDLVINWSNIKVDHAIITANKDSLKIKGAGVFNYSIEPIENQKKDVSNDLITTDLGTFNIFSSNTISKYQKIILGELKKRNPDLDLNQIIFLGDSKLNNHQISLKIAVLEDSLVYKSWSGWIYFNAPIIEGAVALTQLKGNLGELNEKLLNNETMESVILDRFLALNSGTELKKNNLKVYFEEDDFSQDLLYKATIYAYMQPKYLGTIEVNFSFGTRTDLNDLFAIKDLIILKDVVDKQAILSALLEFNSKVKVDLSQLDVQILNDHQAILKPVNGSKDYKNFARLNWIDTRLNLADVISSNKTLDLATSNPSEKDILSGILNINNNSGIIESELKVESSFDNSKSLIVPKTNSKVYKGSVVVNWYDKRESLTQLIINRNLEFNDDNQHPTIEQIQDQMMKLNLNPDLVLSQINIRIINDHEAEVSPIANSQFYKDSVILNWNDDRQSLTELITNTEIKIKQDNISNQEILNLVITENKLDQSIINELSVQRVNNQKVVVLAKPTSKNYKGSVNIDLIDIRQSLTELITNTEINVKTSVPSVNQILTALLEFNPNLVKNELRVLAITIDSAIIAPIANSKVYKDSVSVKLIDNRKFINDLVDNLEITENLYQVNEAILLDWIFKLNPDTVLTKQDIKLESIGDQQASFAANSDSEKYKGSFTIIWKDDRTKLSDLFLNKDIKLDSSNPSDTDIIDALIKANPMLDNIIKSNLKVQSRSGYNVEITATDDSRIYRGSITVHWITTILDLSRIIQKTEIILNLDKPTKDEILNEVIKQNQGSESIKAELLVDKIDLSAHTANIIPNKGSKITGSVAIHWTDTRKELSSFIKNVNLVVTQQQLELIIQNNKKFILDLINEENKVNLSLNDIEISNLDVKTNSVLVRVKDNINYRGEDVKITFSLNPDDNGGQEE